MGQWSEELKELTRREIFPGAVLKSESDFGIVMEMNPRIVINGVKFGGIVPEASDQVIATFDTVNQMIDAGWVLD
jgi:hypothetical protein